MIYAGFNFNGKHLVTDLGYYVADREITPPKKQQITKSVPYMSGSYDFSTLYGEPCYDDRTIKYVINVIGGGIIDLAAKKQELENWLMTCHKGQLIDDTYPDWYFLAECISITENDDGNDYSALTVSFIVSPFKYSVALQTASYAPSAAADVVCDNAGSVTVTPTITCAAAASVVYDGNTYDLGVGSHTTYNFALAPGNNTFNITSAGAVTISWRNEVL